MEDIFIDVIPNKKKFDNIIKASYSYFTLRESVRKNL